MTRLIRWNPWDEMNAFINDMDHWLTRANVGVPVAQLENGGKPSFLPPVEAYRKDNQLILKAELPGVQPEDVEVSVVDGQLLLRGERKQKQEVDREHYYLSESSYGRFERTFALPAGIKSEDVKAAYVNGVLEIKLPISDRSKTHRVAIEGLSAAHKIENQPAA